MASPAREAQPSAAAARFARTMMMGAGDVVEMPMGEEEMGFWKCGPLGF